MSVLYFELVDVFKAFAGQLAFSIWLSPTEPVLVAKILLQYTYETRTLHSKLKIASSKPIRIQNENAFNANTKKKECLLQVQSTLYCFKRPVNERLETNARPRHTDNKAFLLRHLLTARENVDPKFSSVCDDCMY